MVLTMRPAALTMACDANSIALVTVTMAHNVASDECKMKCSASAANSVECIANSMRREINSMTHKVNTMPCEMNSIPREVITM